MPFNFLGTIRQCQWRSFRDWTLNERKSVQARVMVINAELNRIGRITVFYRRRNAVIQTLSGTDREIEEVTEERTRFVVSPGSSLEKLVQAYIAQGGNPMAISLWLQPDDILFSGDVDPNEDPDDNPNEIVTRAGFESTPFDQPYGGVISLLSTDSYDVGGLYPGGLSVTLTDPIKNAGRYVEMGDAGAKIAIKTDWARRWVQQELSELSKLEEKIVKLMDLREQLMKERDSLLLQSIGGSVDIYPLPPDPNRFAAGLHLTQIVTEMDRTFYETNEDGEPDFTRINLGKRADGTPISQPGNDPNTSNAQIIPSGIAFYDTLFADPPGTDPFAA